MERSASPNARVLLAQCGASFPALVLFPLRPASLDTPGNFCFLRVPGYDLIIAVLVTITIYTSKGETQDFWTYLDGLVCLASASHTKL